MMKRALMSLATLTAFGCGGGDASSPMDANNTDDACETFEEIGGTLAADTVLSGCYRVTEQLEARDGLVTIAPGTRFEFEADTGLLVEADGILAADGTATAPIEMVGTTETSGFWKGVAITSQQPDNRLRFVKIAHAGSDVWDPCCPVETAPAALNAFEDAIVQVEDSSFRASGDFGVAFAQGVEVSSFARNTFEDAVGHSVRIFSTNVGALDAASTYGEGAVRVVGVDVASEQSWAAIDATYEVFGAFDVLEGGGVIIEPGATVAFAEDSGVHAAKGVLRVVGTEAARITLRGTTETARWWRGLAWGSRKPDNAIAFADVAHGGSDYWDPCCPQDTRYANLNAHDEALLSVQAVRSSQAPYGLAVNADSELTAFAANTFTDHAEAAVAVSALHLGALDDATSYGDIVLVRASEVVEDANWPAIDVAYEMAAEQDTIITGGATLTIDPGATLLFREEAGLAAEGDGVLVAEGTADAPISFSGTTETAGWWHGLAFTSPGNNRLAHARVAYGGSDYWDPCCPQDSGEATVNVYEGGRLTMTDSTVFGGETYAVYVQPGSTFDASDNDYMGEPTSIP